MTDDLAEEMRETDAFRDLDYDYDMKEIAEMLVDEKAILDENDFAKQSGQIKKSGLIKLLLWTRKQKQRAQNASRNTR